MLRSAKGFLVKGFSLPSRFIQVTCCPQGPPHLITCSMWSQRGVGTWVGVWPGPLPCRNRSTERLRECAKSPSTREDHPAPASTLLSTQSGEGPLSTNPAELGDSAVVGSSSPSFSLCPLTPALTLDWEGWKQDPESLGVKASDPTPLAEIWVCAGKGRVNTSLVFKLQFLKAIRSPTSKCFLT